MRLCDPAETEEHRKQAKKHMEDWPGGEMHFNYYRIARFQDHLVRARNWLPKDDPFFSKVLGGRSGGEFLEALIGPGNAGHRGGPKIRSLVHYPERRNALVESGWDAIQASEDPAIVAARELAVLMRRDLEAWLISCSE